MQPLHYAILIFSSDEPGFRDIACDSASESTTTRKHRSAAVSTLEPNHVVRRRSVNGLLVIYPDTTCNQTRSESPCVRGGGFYN